LKECDRYILKSEDFGEEKGGVIKKGKLIDKELVQ
jgi:hypothetical protein